MVRIDEGMLREARRQFCADISMDWQRYERDPDKKVYIQKMTYASGCRSSAGEGARKYAGGDSFLEVIVCMGQLFLGADEAIYDWACEKFADCEPEWFCRFDNLRMIDQKLGEYGKCIGDTHVYYLPSGDMVRAARQTAAGRGNAAEASGANPANPTSLIWYEQEELLQFKENNRFGSALCFSPTQPDVLAVAARRQDSPEELSGMAGVSEDGKYLWQIGINVDREYTGRGLAAFLVSELAAEVIRRGKTPFYGTSESHTVSQTVACKAGFVPAFTTVYVKERC